MTSSSWAAATAAWRLAYERVSFTSWVDRGVVRVPPVEGGGTGVKEVGEDAEGVQAVVPAAPAPAAVFVVVVVVVVSGGGSMEGICPPWLIVPTRSMGDISGGDHG